MIETNEQFYCTKCKKICTGIDCECTEELDLVDEYENMIEVLEIDHNEGKE